MTTTKQTAQHAYMAAAADISGLVSELQTIADKLHDKDPNSIHWGHVGDLQALKFKLAELTKFTNQQG